MNSPIQVKCPSSDQPSVRKISRHQSHIQDGSIPPKQYVKAVFLFSPSAHKEEFPCLGFSTSGYQVSHGQEVSGSEQSLVKTSILKFEIKKN